MAESWGGMAFDRWLAELRPKLHRYCARMTGSVVDGEDVVQEAITKAFEALPAAAAIERPEAWMFRIAHNAALDFLRHRGRHAAVHSDEDMTLIEAPGVDQDERLAVAASLHTFMQLPSSQRSSVLLKDVLGYTIEEIAEILDGATVASVKATLHRGRSRLQQLSSEASPSSSATLSEQERALLEAYIDRFNARDFDALRDMLADEVRLDLVTRARVSGRAEVGKYYGHYARLDDVRFTLGTVDGRLAALAFDPAEPGSPRYFVLLRWENGQLAGIRDFRYARYVTDGAEITSVARVGAASAMRPCMGVRAWRNFRS